MAAIGTLGLRINIFPERHSPNIIFFKFLTFTFLTLLTFFSNRKAKLIFFYEWVITLDWSGEYKSSMINI